MLRLVLGPFPVRGRPREGQGWEKKDGMGGRGREKILMRGRIFANYVSKKTSFTIIVSKNHIQFQ